MKTLKKFLAVALALALCALCALPALATDAAPSTYTVTMRAPQAGHQYQIYQLFVGDLADEDGKLILSNVKFGNSGILGTAGEDATEESEKIAKMSSEELEEYIQTKVAATENLTPFVADAKTGEENTPITWENLPAGYYLVRDVTENLEGDEVRFANMVEVVSDVTITPKADKPTSEKKEGINAADGVEEIKPANGIYNIGDNVPFTVTAKIPAAELNRFLNAPAPENGYSYFAKLVDKMTEGLVLNEDSIQVQVSGKLLEKNQYAIATAALDPAEKVQGKTQKYVSTFSMTIANLFGIIGTDEVANDVVITMTYTARLTEDAKINGTLDDPSAVNKAHLEFSNDPYDQGDGSTGETPDDDVPVYTFYLNGGKVDGDDKPLEGAGFQLFWGDTTENQVILYRLEENGPVFALPQGTTELPEKVEVMENGVKVLKSTIAVGNNEIVSDKDGAFVINGLKPGTYTLHESTTPAGYNTCPDQVITIVEQETHGGCIYTYGEVTDANQVKVVNNKGSLLPSTGGIGTTIFYVVGGALVVGAGVLLFTKKRIGSKG